MRRSNNAAVIGKTPENTPEWTGSLYGEYRPQAAPGLALGAVVLTVATESALSDACRISDCVRTSYCASPGAYRKMLTIGSRSAGEIGSRSGSTTTGPGGSVTGPPGAHAAAQAGGAWPPAGGGGRLAGASGDVRRR